MPRPRSQNRKIECKVPPLTYERIQRLADEGAFGDNLADVARYLIIRGLEEVSRSALLPPDPDKPESPSKPHV